MSDFFSMQQVKRAVYGIRGERKVMEGQRLKKLLVVATVISGAAAAYLMYRRGVPLFAIATKAITNPVGALASEVGTAVQSGPSA